MPIAHRPHDYAWQTKRNLEKEMRIVDAPPKPEDEQRLIPPSRSQGPWNRLTKKLQPIATPVYLKERRATASRPAEAYILCANKQYVVGLTERPSCKSVGLLCNCSQPDSSGRLLPCLRFACTVEAAFPLGLDRTVVSFIADVNQTTVSYKHRIFPPSSILLSPDPCRSIPSFVVSSQLQYLSPKVPWTLVGPYVLQRVRGVSSTTVSHRLLML